MAVIGAFTTSTSCFCLPLSFLSEFLMGSRRHGGGVVVNTLDRSIEISVVSEKGRVVLSDKKL